jgi:uncharacterized protein
MAGKFPDDGKLKVAVVIGGHSFEVPGFKVFWDALDGVDAYIQTLEDWSDDIAGVQKQYDCVVFYNMHTFTPTGEESWPMTKAKESLEALGETEQGIVIWHHSLVAFRKWPLWREISGLEYMTLEVAFDQTMSISVVNTDHPITDGVTDFEIVDETYDIANPVGDMDVLLETDHPKNASKVGWTRTHRNARVFCLQLGHDSQAWANPSLSKLMGNGIRWAARRQS